MTLLPFVMRAAGARQSHLNDGVGLERLEAALPQAFEITWSALLASSLTPLHQTTTYVRQLESVIGRWRDGDYSMLQPVAAYPFMPIAVTGFELKKETGRKELDLLGQSSGARAAAEGDTPEYRRRQEVAAKGGEQAT
jgi:hypothetical protein